MSIIPSDVKSLTVNEVVDRPVGSILSDADVKHNVDCACDRSITKINKPVKNKRVTLRFIALTFGVWDHQFTPEIRIAPAISGNKK